MFERTARFLSTLSDRRTRLRRRIEDVFNREVLGAVVVTTSLMKTIEKALNAEPALLVAWVVVFLVGVWVFVKWDALADAADGAVESAADAAEQAADG